MYHIWHKKMYKKDKIQDKVSSWEKNKLRFNYCWSFGLPENSQTILTDFFWWCLMGTMKDASSLRLHQGYSSGKVMKGIDSGGRLLCPTGVSTLLCYSDPQSPAYSTDYQRNWDLYSYRLPTCLNQRDIRGFLSQRHYFESYKKKKPHWLASGLRKHL